MKRIFGAANVVIAISLGIIVLLGYFINRPEIQGFGFIFLQWAVILAGIAVIIGISNLFSVHLQKIHERRPGSVYSLILLFFMLLTLLFSVTPGLEPYQKLMLNGILIPSEISLMAVLAVTLIYASIRLLRLRSHWTSVLFLTTAFLVLLGTLPLPVIGQIPYLRDFVQIFATGGARGILIGVALGTLTTGLRILFAVDRPYGGNG
jgi:hypothetical protein